MMLDDVEECQLSGPIGELVPFTTSWPAARPANSPPGQRSRRRRDHSP